jgi:hypothetical protein
LLEDGVDRWISPALGTPSGKWTTDLLAVLRSVEGHLALVGPKSDISSLPQGYFEMAAKDLTARGIPNATPKSLREDFINYRKTSEQIVIGAIGKLQDAVFQVADADISHFD